MLSVNEEGHVIISLDDSSYDLTISKDYSDFLLRVTSPSSNLNEGCFEVEEGLDDDRNAKALRYSEFLVDFLQRREKMLEVVGELTSAQEREQKIKSFVDRLNNK